MKIHSRVDQRSGSDGGIQNCTTLEAKLTSEQSEAVDKKHFFKTNPYLILHLSHAIKMALGRKFGRTKTYTVVERSSL